MTKKLTAIILSLLIMLSCSAAYADASLDAQADKAQVSAGDTVTVTITLKGDKLAAAEGSFAYDTSLLSFEEAEGGAGDGYISMVSLSKGGESSLSARITFKALAEGNAEVAFSITKILNYSGKELGAAEQKASVTILPGPEPTPTPEPTATPEPTPEPVAAEITDGVSLSDSIGGYTPILRDGDRTSRIDYRAGNTLRISSETPIAALYLYWYTPCEAFTVHTAAGDVPGGEYGFLHEYLALPEAVTELDIEFSGLSPLCEVRLFTTGAAPADVQVWQPPCEQADVLLFPSHADDDVIFFGALAAQCVDRGLAVQVAYLVNHYDWQPRPQELLDALWTMGIRNYPVIGPFPDYYVLSLEAAQQSFGEENVIAYQVGLLRRFKPLVAVGHDREGEYGHGAHRLNALALEQAVVYAADASYDAESAARYGVWDTPKLYLHFADENPIILDVETPLESFGGKTAFEVASEAMLCHESQLQYAHRPTLASEEFPRYDCRRFGLVRSLVGADTGNDIMEHLS